ncbi:MAG TPA: GDSL-type esterase/lipase family protein [Mycobacteriales bacterium]|nr:GDSL-type esterase/lipase family protein [Mycobacteriales bacterium]
MTRRQLIAAIAACGLTMAALVTAGLAVSRGAGAATGSAVDNRPTAIVSLGDSAISGEGAGSYAAGTDGPDDYCHRSAAAMIHETGVAVDKTVNLACSGATAENLQIGGPSHYTETSQASQLAPIAERYHVKMLVVQVGANDDPDFSDVITDCILAWVNPLGKSCQDKDGAAWSQRTQAMIPKVEKAISDLRAVMRDAGYADSGYQFVLLSYASPVTGDMDAAHAVEGCPLRKSDADWGRNTAVPQLSSALAQAASAENVRFLSLASATAGHEACNTSGSAAWENGIKIELSDLPNGLTTHLVQQSFHPDAQGHHEFGGCLGEFYAMTARTGSCVAGPGGELHARSG